MLKLYVCYTKCCSHYSDGYSAWLVHGDPGGELLSDQTKKKHAGSDFLQEDDLHNTMQFPKCTELETVLHDPFLGGSGLFPLLIEGLPVDVDEGLAVHAVDVEDPIQMVHLMLEDSGWPAACLPRDIFTLLIQACREKGNTI